MNYMADALGFLGLSGQSIKIEDNLRLNLVHATAAPPVSLASGYNPRLVEDIINAVTQFKADLLKDSGKVQIVTFYKDIGRAKIENRLAVVLGLQNSPCSRLKTVDELNLLAKKLHEIGIRVIAPAYKELNEFGSGWENAGIGLTIAGRVFVEACGYSRIIVDLSHCGHQTARDILNTDTVKGKDTKIMASHNGCYMRYHHIRNLPDDVLKGVADKGGVVGIPLLTFALHDRNCHFDDFVGHLKHALNVCGEDAVVIGSDAPYVNVNREKARENFFLLKDIIDPVGLQGARYPEYLASGPNIMHWIGGLLKYKLKSSILEKVLGLNLEIFFEKNI